MSPKIDLKIHRDQDAPHLTNPTANDTRMAAKEVADVRVQGLSPLPQKYVPNHTPAGPLGYRPYLADAGQAKPGKKTSTKVAPKTNEPVFTPSVKLPAHLEAHLKSKGLSQEYTRFFYEILVVYGFTPQTEEDVDILANPGNIRLLIQESTQDFYHYFRDEFGYAFEPAFVTSLKEIVDWNGLKLNLELIMMRVERQALLSFLAGEEAKEINADDIYEALDRAYRNRLNNFLNRFQQRDHKILREILGRLDTKASMEGLRFYAEEVKSEGDRWRQKLKSLRFSMEGLKVIGDGAYMDDALLLALASIEHQDILYRLNALVRDLKPAAGRITTDCIKLIPIFKTDSILTEFVVWYHTHFGRRFTISELSYLPYAPNNRNIYDDVFDRQTLEFTPQTARQIKSLVKSTGVELDPTKIKSYVWSPKAYDFYRKFLDKYGIEPLNQENINNYWHYFAAGKISGSRRPPDLIFEPEVIKATMALVINDLSDKEKKRAKAKGFELDEVLYSCRSVLKYEKKVPGTATILRRLTDAGVNVTGYDLRNNFNAETTTATLRVLVEKDELVAEIQAMVNHMPALKHKLAISDVSKFIKLSDSVRGRLTDSKFTTYLELLGDKYDFELSYKNVEVFAVHALKEESFLRTHGGYLQKPAVMNFYARNRHLFFGPDDKDKKLDVKGIARVLRLYLISLKNPNVMEHAKLWHRRMQDEINSMFFHYYEQGDTRLLADPRCDQLIAELTKMGLQKQIDFFHIQYLVPELRVLKNEKFQRFFKDTGAAYMLEPNIWNVDDAAKVYKNQQLRTFLEKNEAKEFAAKLAQYGYKPDWDEFEELKSLYETKDFLTYLKRFEDTYKLSLSKAVNRASKTLNSPLAMIVKIYTNSFQEFDFFAEFKALMDSGDIHTLVSPQAKKAYEHMNSTLGYEFNLFDMTSFTSLLKIERIKDYVLSVEFAAFWKKLRKHCEGLEKLSFDLSLTSVYTDLGWRKELVFQTLDSLKSIYNYHGPQDASELYSLRDLLQNPSAQRILTGDKCKEIVAALQKKHGYKFDIKDTWGLIYLASREGEIDRLYRDEVDAFASRALGRTLGNNLVDRVQIAESLAVEDQEKIAFFASNDYRATSEKLASYMPHLKLGMPIEGLNMVYVAHKNPKVFDFLKAIKYEKALLKMESLLEHIPGLASLAKDPRAAELVKGLRSIKYVKDRGYYRFHPSDGPALRALLEEYTPQQIVNDAQALINAEGGAISANDIYYYIRRKETFSFDRAKLEAAVKAGFAQDIHRLDSNFDSYNSYNDPSKLSIVDLNKAVELRKWLPTPKARRAIGGIVDRDIKKYPASELGGVLTMGQKPMIMEGEPKVDFNNGSYAMPQETTDLLSLSLVHYHLHATVRDDALLAGPSGDKFFGGGDVTFAEAHNIDGIVITSVDKNSFCVHFYNPNKDVVFLGTYTIDTPQ